MKYLHFSCIFFEAKGVSTGCCVCLEYCWIGLCNAATIAGAWPLGPCQHLGVFEYDHGTQHAPVQLITPTRRVREGSMFLFSSMSTMLTNLFFCKCVFRLMFAGLRCVPPVDLVFRAILLRRQTELDGTRGGVGMWFGERLMRLGVHSLNQAVLCFCLLVSQNYHATDLRAVRWPDGKELPFRVSLTV